jgi:hypothetical protein
MSLPSFVHDVAWAFASWVNSESYRFAAGETASYPMVAPEGGREPLRAEYSAYTMGSDHDVYQDSAFGIPSIYLNDWPDRYIHTNFDTAANIDPTKLKRAAFIGAASGYFLASFSSRDAAVAKRAVEIGRLLRTAEMMERDAVAPAAVTPVTATASTHSSPAAPTGSANPAPPSGATPSANSAPPAAPALSARSVRPATSTAFEEYERDVLNSIDAYSSSAAPPNYHRSSGAAADHDGAPIFRRRPEPRGPLMVFGYNYFADHAQAAGISTPHLLSYEGSWGSGEEYAYEALNFADGRRSTRQITAALTAEYGPVPDELVLEYLQALQKIGVLTTR